MDIQQLFSAAEEARKSKPCVLGKWLNSQSESDRVELQAIIDNPPRSINGLFNSWKQAGFTVCERTAFERHANKICGCYL